MVRSPAPLKPRAFSNASMSAPSARAKAGSGRACPASRRGWSRVHLRSSQATGLMSMAVASQPSRMASSGIAPPPAKGSSTLGARPPWASRISRRKRSSSGPFSRPQWRMPPTVSSLAFSTVRPPTRLRSIVSTVRPPMRSRTRRRPSGVPGSGSSAAINAARAAASGLRAGQICSVETCPCRTFFSCTESSDACLRGNAASMRRRGASVMGAATVQELHRNGEQFFQLFRKFFRIFELCFDSGDSCIRGYSVGNPVSQFNHTIDTFFDSSSGNEFFQFFGTIFVERTDQIQNFFRVGAAEPS